MQRDRKQIAPEAPVGEAGVDADEATGQVPVGRMREELLLPEEQAATDHEPYGATELPTKEKRPRRR